MGLEAPYFSSPCLTSKRKSWILLRQLRTRESVTQTAYQLILINWLTKVTNNLIVQGLRPVHVVGVGSNENCRDSETRLDEVSVELDPGHGRHMDVSDQASRFDEMR